MGQSEIWASWRRVSDRRRACHISRMTTYTLVPQPDGTFEVYVERPGTLPVPVTGFKSEAEARVWVADDQKRPYERRLKRPRDPAQLAKLIVDIATGEVEDRIDDGKDPAAVERGRVGGAKGGKARATALTGAKRVAIAKQAAKIRWSVKKP